MLNSTDRRKTGFACLALVGLMALTACADKEEVLEGERLDLRPDLTAATTTDEQAIAASQIAAFSVPAQQVNADWTHKNGTAAHRITHPALSSAPTLRWSRDIGSGNRGRLRLSSDPIIAGGVIYVMDSSGLVSAFAQQSGSPLWTRSLKPLRDARDAAPGGGLAFGSDTLVATTGFGEVITLDPATGNIRWRHRMPAAVVAAPVISGDVIVALARNNLAAGLTLDHGRIKWEIQGVDADAGVLGTGAPAIAGRLAILPFTSGQVVAVVPRNGLTAWNQKVSGKRLGVARGFVSAISSDPVANGNSVYLGTQAGRLARIDRRSGERDWTSKEGALGPVWPADNSLFIVSDQGKLKRLDAATGDPIWSADLPVFKNTKKLKGAYAHFGPILAGGVLWVAGSDGALRKFNPANGQPLGAINIPGGAAASPAVAGGVMYILSQNGQLHAFQ